MLQLSEEGCYMIYTIKELSQLAGVSARTLRYYDEINLLKPKYVNNSGYRFYGKEELLLLQQILFYRERGFRLKDIKDILSQDQFTIMQALKEHLMELEEQRQHLDSLIHMVKDTISSLKGEYKMSDKEKFQAFKDSMIEKNEANYGEELNLKYGKGTIEKSNQKIRQMSEEDWIDFKNLETNILEYLEQCVLSKRNPQDEEGKQLVLLHKKWLLKIWHQYTPAAHKGVAMMYTADKRFMQYYDGKIPGCARFLEEAIQFWAEHLEDYY